MSTTEKTTLLGIKPFNYRFTGLKEIGKGATGKVFLARDTFSGQAVALKTSKCESNNGFLYNEAVALFALPKNPHLPRLVDCGYDDSLSWLATNFISGDLLSERLKAEQILFPEALALTRQAAVGLAAAAQNDIYHRDIKPGNLMIDWRKQLQIIDFGLARVNGEKRPSELGAAGASSFMEITMIDEEELRLFGTPGFMSPEAINGEAVDCRSGIFSLGVVFYEMVTGSLPFSPKFGPRLLEAIRHGPPQLSTVSPDHRVQSMTEAFARKFTAFDRGQRFQTYEEVITAVEAIENNLDEVNAKISRWLNQLPAALANFAYAE